MTANIQVSEKQAPQDPDSALAFSMEGTSVAKPSSLNPGVWAPSWNSNQAVNKFQDEIGGHLRADDPGVRLFDKVYRGRWLKPKLKTQSAPDNQLIAVSIFHIFGSEACSQWAPAIAERMPEAYLALNPKQAEILGLSETDPANLTTTCGQYQLPVKYLPGLVMGLAGLPFGLPGVPAIAANSVVEVSLTETREAL